MSSLMWRAIRMATWCQNMRADPGSAGRFADVLADLAKGPIGFRNQWAGQLEIVDLPRPHSNFGRHSRCRKSACGQSGVVQQDFLEPETWIRVLGRPGSM